MYVSCTIFYFSGTGNAKQIAQWLYEKFTEFSIPTEIYPIQKSNNIHIPNSKKDLIICISPVHGFNFPPIMLSFLYRFKKGENPVYIMNTRAGMKIGSWVTPGLSGISLYLAACIMKLKGYSIRGLIPFDMPSNWLSLHPALNTNTYTYLFATNYSRVDAYSKKIYAGKRIFKSCIELIQDIIISPIAIAYYCIGRFFIAKSFYATSACTQCNICINNCPVQAISYKNKRPYWSFTCESCMKCMNSCPSRAIETWHGIITFILVIKSIFISSSIYFIFQNKIHFDLEHSLYDYIISPLTLLTFTYIIYRISHWLLRYKWYERIVIITSLTSYAFWGRCKKIRFTVK